MSHAKRQSRILHHSFIALMSAVLISCGNAEVKTSESHTDTAAAPESKSKSRIEGKQNSSAAAALTAPIESGIAIEDIATMSPSELMSAATVESNRLANVLSSVSDQASAEAAIAQMRGLGPQIKALSARMETLQEGDMTLSIKTMKQLQGFAEAQMRIFNETGRIAVEHPELRDIITEGFEDIEIDF